MTTPLERIAELEAENKRATEAFSHIVQVSGEEGRKAKQRITELEIDRDTFRHGYRLMSDRVTDLEAEKERLQAEVARLQHPADAGNLPTLSSLRGMAKGTTFPDAWDLPINGDAAPRELEQIGWIIKAPQTRFAWFEDEASEAKRFANMGVGHTVTPIFIKPHSHGQAVEDAPSVPGV